MIADLRPYPAMKDSGVPWLGEVPGHWEVLPVGRYVRVKSGDMISSDDERENGIPIYGGNGIRGYTFRANTQGPMILLGRVGAKCGCVHFVEGDFWASEHALRVLPQAEIDLRFLALALGHADLNRLAIRTAQPLINSTIVRSHRAAFPPLPEQSTIVRFLDHADRRIRRYIRAKRRLIELLSEQKQAIIHRAVTRGLDPNVRLKPSGVEWLGDVPEHWERRAVWQLFQIGRGKVTSHEYIANHPGPFPLYSSQTANDGVMGHIDTFMFDGDYLTWTTDGAHAGTVFRRSGKFNCTNVCGTLFPKIRLDLDFMRTAVASETKRQVRLDINPKLMNNMMARIRVNVPPYDEQVQMANYVQGVVRPSDSAIERAQLEIGLLREYRTRLIADVVTGKLDVREAAARLPDEADEPEPFDDADAQSADDEGSEDADLHAASGEVEA